MVYPRLNGSSDLKRLVNLMYKNLRCGLYHTVSPAPNIIINPDLTTMPNGKAFYARYTINQTDFDELIICPELLYLDLQKDFKAFISMLKNPTNTNLRVNFGNAIKRQEL